MLHALVAVALAFTPPATVTRRDAVFSGLTAAAIPFAAVADDAADDLKLILAQQKHKDKKDLQAQAQADDSPAGNVLKSPRADKKPVDLKRRRKGFPLKSLKPLMLANIGAAAADSKQVAERAT